MIQEVRNTTPLRDMNIQQLFDLVDRYPWYAFARRELYIKMRESNPDYAESYLKKYVPYLFSGRAISPNRLDFDTDKLEPEIKHIEEYSLLSDLISGAPETERPEVKVVESKPHRYIVGGDYFGKDDLKSVQGEVITFKLNRDDAAEVPEVKITQSYETYNTETLAKIYSEQGFYQRAIDIYEKLILLYPEKYTYFASLIKDLKKKL